MTSETYVERRVPLFRRRPASRCVINVREGAGAKKFCRSNERRKTAEGGVRKSIFTFQTVGSVYKTRGWKKGRLNGGWSHLVPGCGQVLAFEGKPRREGLLNPPETRTLRPVPAKDPRPLFGPLNIDTAAKTPRRPYVFPPYLPSTTSRVESPPNE